MQAYLDRGQSRENKIAMIKKRKYIEIALPDLEKICDILLIAGNLVDLVNTENAKEGDMIKTFHRLEKSLDELSKTEICLDSVVMPGNNEVIH